MSSTVSFESWRKSGWFVNDLIEKMSPDDLDEPVTIAAKHGLQNLLIVLMDAHIPILEVSCSSAGGFDVLLSGNYVMQCDDSTGEFGAHWFVPSLDPAQEGTFIIPSEEERLLECLKTARWPVTPDREPIKILINKLD